MKTEKSFHKKPQKLTGRECEGLLISHYGIHADIETDDGKIVRCHLRKNADPLTAGDRVLWVPEESSENSGIIQDYLPRKSLLSRPEGKNRMKPLAANIDALVIVTAPQALFEHLLDRFLVAAEHFNLEPLIVFNKSDLLTENARAEITTRLKVYQSIGYKALFSNTVTPNGLTELKQFLATKSAVLVGASGVGKSSIIASLSQDLSVKVGETSSKGQGKHTTTFTRLYHLPTGGTLIDSPGVREFGVSHMTEEEILRGFIEFKPFLDDCKYRNCRHGKDRDCALNKALEEGKIAEKRFRSYKELTD